MADRPTPAEVRAEGRRLLAVARNQAPDRPDWPAWQAFAIFCRDQADVLLADPEPPTVIPEGCIVTNGILGWGNRKVGLEAYGPGGRWHVGPTTIEGSNAGDLLGDHLDLLGAGEGSHLVVIAVPPSLRRDGIDASAIIERITEEADR